MFAAIPILLTLVLLLSGCSNKTQESDFSFVNGPEPESLDPAIISGQPEFRLCSALFEGLTTRNAKGEIIPGIAERWEISPDERRYTFYLRPSSWNNGDPLTAFDFLKSWERAIHPSLASPYAELLYPISGAEAYNRGKNDRFETVGVKATSPQTLEVTLNAPTPYFLELCTMPTLSPVHFPSLKRWPRDWIKPGKLISNGAYMLEQWRLDDKIVLAANPNYWRAESVHFKRVTAHITDSATTAFNLFFTQCADLVIDKNLIPTLHIDRLRQLPEFHSNPFLATYFYRFNVTKKPFNDKRVRLAFALSIDKERIVSRITRAGEPVAGSFTPPGMPGYTPPDGLKYDPQRARRLLAEAGYPNGKDFPNIQILYNSSKSSSDQNQQVAVEIQSMWKETLGVSVGLRKQEWKVYLNSMDQLDFDIVRSSWVGDYSDPSTFLDCFVTGRGNNRTGWSSPQYDKLMAQSTNEGNGASRINLLKEAETILVRDEMPIVPLFYFVGMALYDENKLGGFHPNLVDDHPLREMYWKTQK